MYILMQNIVKIPKVKVCILQNGQFHNNEYNYYIIGL